MRTNPAKFLLGALVSLLCVSQAWGYVYLTADNTAPIVWFPGSIPMQIMVDDTVPKSDGQTFAGCIQTSMQLWNAQINTVQLAPATVAVGNGTDHNGVNEIFFASAPYGTSWDSSTLALTITWYYTGSYNGQPTAHATEDDILINPNYSWDSYRGPLHFGPTVYDLQRVVLHELGHVLGLDHPDLNGQPGIIALMNSHVSDLDTLQTDDINGAQSLYGVRNSAPQIVQNPANQTLNIGQGVQFSVSATGAPQPTYRWQRLPAAGGGWGDLSDTATYTGTGTSDLFVHGVTVGMSGDQFRCVATNTNGSATSTPATLTVLTGTAPTITNPSNTTVPTGYAAFFTVSATGSPTPSLQWQWQPVAGGGFSNLPNDGSYAINGSTLSLGAVRTTLANTGDQYRCVATNVAGSATSAAATLTVIPYSLPTITAQPQPLTLAEGATATFSVTATSPTTMTYMWLMSPDNGVNWYALGDVNGYSGTHTATLTLSGTQYTSHNGLRFRCEITNLSGSVDSNNALLTLTVPPAIVQLAAGKYHSLRTDAQGQFWSTGGNSSGQLGTGNTTQFTTPQLVTLPGGRTVAAVSAGSEHSLLLTTTGELWVMGLNANGQLGDGTLVAKSTPFQLASNVAGIAAGKFHTAFLKTDGTLWTVGGNDEGQVGNGDTSGANVLAPVQIASNVVELAAGTRQTLFVKSDGTLWGTGDFYNNGTLFYSPVQLATGVKTVAAGAYHSLFLKTDTSVWALGFNAYGQLGDNTTTTRTTPVLVTSGVKAIAAGPFHSAYLMTGNTLFTFGYNSSGQLGDGSVVNRPLPTFVASNVSAVNASESDTFITKTDGSLWGMGANLNGQFGVASPTSSNSVTYISGGILGTPSVPTGVVAAGNAGNDRMNLTWRPTGTATGYEVWRNTTNNFGAATRLAQNIRWAFFQDLTAVINTTYYYWVTSVSAGGTSAPSSVVTGSFGTNTAPVFTLQPTAQVVVAPASATFTVATSGTPSPTLQWQRMPFGSGTWSDLSNAGSYSGVTTFTLTVSNTSGSMDGDQFRCMATNVVSSVNSSAVTLTVGVPTVPNFTTQPLPQSVSLGATATFTVAASGVPAPTLQWQRQPLGSGPWSDLANAGSYSGVTTGTLSVSNTTLVMSSDQFRCVATNGSGSANSNTAALTVNLPSPPSITTQPQPHTVGEGTTTTFTVAATSTAPLTYVWQVYAYGGIGWDTLTNTGVYSGTGTATLTLTAVNYSLNGSSYRCQISNAGGSVTSAGAVLTVTTVNVGVVKISAGRSNGLYIKANGSLWGMGQNTSGSLGDGSIYPHYFPENISLNVIASACGRYHSLFVKSDQSLWGMGSDNSGQLGDGTTAAQRTTPLFISAGAIAVSAGDETSYFITANGSLYAIGDNSSGALGDGTYTTRTTPVLIASDVVSVAAGEYFMLLLKGDGSLWGVGQNGSGQLGLANNSTQLSPVLITAGVAAIAAGYDSSIILKTDGSAWTFGNNHYGELGDGTTNARYGLYQVATGVRAIAAGWNHTFFAKTDGTLWATGISFLGNGTSTGSSTPIMVATNVAEIATGDSASFYALNDGSLWGFGTNGFGNVGTGDNSPRAAPFAVAYGLVNAPAAVTGLAGTTSTGIAGAARLTWVGSVEAARYEIWRNSVNNFGSATRLAGDILNPIFYDLAPSAGANYYWVNAVNSGGSALSSVLSLVGTGASSITTQPLPQSVVEGGTATFTVGVSGAPVPTMQWQRQPAGGGGFSNLSNAGSYSGVTTATLSISSTTLAMNGDQFRCVATNTGGTATSYGVALTIIPPPLAITIGVQTNPKHAAAGSVVRFNLTATNIGTATWSIQYLAAWLIPGNYVTTVSLAGTAPGVGQGVDLDITAPASPGTYVYHLQARDDTNGFFGPQLDLTVIVDGSATNDFNGDGKSDLLLTNTATGDRAIWLMNGTSIASGTLLGSLPNSWVFSAVGDFNADGKSDILLTNTVTAERAIWLMNGTSIAAGASLGVLSTDWVVSGTGDFNADGKSDILLANSVTGDRAIWLMNGTSIAAGALLGSMPTNWAFSAVADFNGDGKSDILLTNTATGERAIWQMNGTSIAAGASLGILPTDWAISGTGDFNGDGKGDVLLTNTVTGDRAIWLMNGMSIAAGAVVRNLPTSWVISAVGDFNGDGKADILLTNTSTGERAIWLMNGTTIAAGASLGILPTTWQVKN